MVRIITVSINTLKSQPYYKTNYIQSNKKGFCVDWNSLRVHNATLSDPKSTLARLGH